MTATATRPTTTTAPATPEGLRPLPSGEFGWAPTFEANPWWGDPVNGGPTPTEPCLRFYRCVDGAWLPAGRRFAEDTASGWGARNGSLPIHDDDGRPTAVELTGDDAAAVRGFAARAPRRKVPVTVYSQNGDRKHSSRCTSAQECRACAQAISAAEDRAKGWD